MKYMLRRTLLEWHGEKAVADTVDYCRKHGIESCMIVTESHDQHPFPRIRAQQQAYCRGLLAHAIREIKAAGIEAGINVWFTCGMYDAGGPPEDVAAETRWTRYVDWRGNESLLNPAPLCPEWRAWVADHYELFASTRPDYIFIDDDFRLHNHGQCGLGSFDALMLREFARRTGREFTRGELVAAVLEDSGAGSVRGQWLELLGDVMIENAGVLRAAVDRVDDRIALGLMSSMPETHSAEGRRWSELLRALAGPRNRPLNRPCMGNYRQTDFRNLVASHIYPAFTRHAHGPGVRSCAEIETANGGLHAKSVTMLRAMFRTAILSGCDDLTLNIYDFLNQPLGENAAFDRLLDEERPLLKRLQAVCRGARPRGIQIFSHPQSALAVQDPKTYDDLVVRLGWAAMLPLLGSAITFEDEPVKAISGDVLRLLSRAEIEEIFRGGVLLDGSAAKALTDLGLESLSGVRVSGRSEHMENLGAEEITDPELGPVGRLMPSRHLMGDSRGLVLEPLPGAVTGSTIWRHLQEFFSPGIVRYENVLGGRVATISHDAQSDCMAFASGWTDSITFRNALRKGMFEAVLRWLWRGAPPALVTGAPDVMCFRLDAPDGTVVAAVQSLHSDTLEAALELAGVGSETHDLEWADGEPASGSPSRILLEHGESRILIARPIEAADGIESCPKVRRTRAMAC
jgi:hypothetical protein